MGNGQASNRDTLGCPRIKAPSLNGAPCTLLLAAPSAVATVQP